jgi:hypothetical protein
MDFSDAVHLYEEGRRLIDATRELAVQHDRVRWTREDLEEALLDLKLGVLDGDAELVDEALTESAKLMSEMISIVNKIVGRGRQE